MTLEQQKQVFESWLKQHKALLFKVVRAYAFTNQDQEDLFQEITLQIWESINNYRSKSSESTWIYKVSLYTAMAWSRSEKKRQKTLQSWRQQVEWLKHGEEQDPQLDWLYRQIQQLDPMDRSMLLLLLEGYSYSEMSSILGISQSNVGVKINRIKKQFINRLTQEPYEF